MNRKRIFWKKELKGLRILWPVLISGILLLPGCGSREVPENETYQVQGERAGGETANEPQLQDMVEEKDGFSGESAGDGVIDFKALKSLNSDIFAWLYVPGTGIDCPVLQSQEADDYYESHNACGEVSEEGAAYTELANLKDMCDFNTVIHGKAVFDDLLLFADSAFFEEHERMEIYLEDNVLTYTVFAAYERENTSLIRSYDFTYGSGCEEFLEDMYGLRSMGKNLREGWEDVTPYHFLVTLTAHGSTDPEKQFVVIGALVSDAAGKIDRQVEW